MLNVKNARILFYKNFEIQSQIEARQLGCGQDYVAHGFYDNEFGRTYWVVACDGHGRPQAIEMIRSINLQEIMKEAYPWKTIQMFIESANGTSEQKIKSGSTMVYTKIHIYDDDIQVVVTNIGDSRAIVFVNK